MSPKNKMFSTKLDKKLIACVKQNPSLYDSSISRQMDSDVREVIWHKIGDALRIPPIEFAAIQCQVQYGDFQEEKHKPGLIENLKEYLPEQYCSASAERKILKLFQKNQVQALDLSQLEAKHLYIKTARALPTFGVTFFLVKEKQQKGKKKLVHRLLGLSADCVLRLDEDSKEILQRWPLTQVKTYHASRNDTFTLDFGDYSDREYCVKTNDAFRIRDILEGYIDIIRRRMAAPYGTSVRPHSAAIGEDCVEQARGNVMTIVSNTPAKMVEQSFIGPSRIVDFQQGTKVPNQGTQIMTLQQVVVTNKGTVQHQAMCGAVPMRNDMSQRCVKKLNRMNSNAVTVVKLLIDSAEENVSKVRELCAAMEADMPELMQGIKAASDNQANEAEKRKLLEEADELWNLVSVLAGHAGNDDFIPVEVSATAQKVANMAAQIYFNLDSKSKARSDIIRRSRTSFILDEKNDDVLRRASFLVAASSATGAVDKAKIILNEEYSGAVLTSQDVEDLERAVVDKMGRLNAAVAIILIAHADPKNIDYTSAVVCMNKMKDILPELARDAATLSSSLDGADREQLLAEIRGLLDLAAALCALTGQDDHEKIHQAAKEFADVSGRLVYTIGRRNPRINADKENEIMDRAKDVGEAMTLLLIQANDLTAAVPHDPSAQTVDEVGVACAARVSDLLTCAQLTSPTIHSPHCQSALTASAENLSSQAQALARTWKPLVEDQARGQVGEQLQHHTFKLAEALDRLRNSYADLEGVIEDNEGEVFMEDPQMEAGRRNRLRFLVGVRGARDVLDNARGDLDQPLALVSLSAEQTKQLERNISSQLAQVDAAVAILFSAYSDPQNPDFEKAESSIRTITDLVPSIVYDTKSLAASCEDPIMRQAILNDIRSWSDALAGLSQYAGDGDSQKLDEFGKNFAKSSRRLSFVFSPRASRARELLVLELTSSANLRAQRIVEDATELAGGLGGEAEGLRGRATALGDSVRELKTTTQLLAPSLHSPHCQSVLLSSTELVASSAQELVSTSSSLQDPETGCRDLAATLQRRRDGIRREGGLLLGDLEGIRASCDGQDEIETETAAARAQRLTCVALGARARAALAHAGPLIDQTYSVPKPSEQEARQIQDKLSTDVAQVNAAVASLMRAHSNADKPHYNAAELALKTITELLPRIIHDSKALNTSQDAASVAASLSSLRAWCGAVRDLCAADQLPPKELEENAYKFGQAIQKLKLIRTVPRDPTIEEKLSELSESACVKANTMVEETRAVVGQMSPSSRYQLQSRGCGLATAARVLRNTAQLSLPTIHEVHSRAALSSAADLVSARGRDLVCEAAGLQDPWHTLHEHLEVKRQDMEADIEGIRDGCGGESPSVTQQRQQFMSRTAAAQRDVADAALLMKKPVDGVTLDAQQTGELHDKLVHNMAEVNAAVAVLVNVTSNAEKPDYNAAELALKTIAELMPTIITDTYKVNAAKDETARVAALTDLRAWCEVLSALCAGFDGGHTKELEQSAQKLAAASRKLKFVRSGRRNSVKEHQLSQVCVTASTKAQHMVAEARRVADAVGMVAGSMLREKGAALDRAESAMRTTAQLTIPTIHEPQCWSSLATSSAAVSAAAQELVSASGAGRHPGCQDLAEELARQREMLERALLGVREACRPDANAAVTRAKPPVPIKKSTLSKSDNAKGDGPLSPKGPLSPTSPDSPVVTNMRRASHDFLEQLRKDESAIQDGSALARRKAEEERRLRRLEFANAVSAADCTLSELHRGAGVGGKEAGAGGAAVDDGVLQRKIEQKLALAGVAAAKLVAANHSEVMDFSSATEAVLAMSQVMSELSKEVQTLSSNRGDMALQEHLTILCGAARRLCGTVKTDRQNVNNAAVSFGDECAKLMYAVCTEVDPAQESQVISLAKAIGDSVSKLALSGAGAGDAQRVCEAGRNAAERASVLVYTAKLLASSIQQPVSRNALAASCASLANQVTSFTAAWTRTAEDPALCSTVAELTAETSRCEALLEAFHQDLNAGKMVKRKEVVVIEDTALRRLASRIMDNAKLRAESSLVTAEQRRELNEYSGKLSQAIRALDLSNTRKKRAPNDVARRQELENAIQALQVTALQMRPSAMDKAHDNIVDLTDLVRDVSREAERLSSAVAALTAADDTAVHTIKGSSQKMALASSLLLNPPDNGDAFDDALQVHHFAQDCEDRVQSMSAVLEHVGDKKLKEVLRLKLMTLAENSCYLKFASHAALANAQSAALDEALEDLADLETKVDRLLLPGDHHHVHREKGAPSPALPLSRALLTASCARVCARAHDVPAAFTAHVAQLSAHVAAHDRHGRQSLKQHVCRVLQLLKLLKMSVGTRVATWEAVQCPLVATIIRQIVEELESGGRKVLGSDGTPDPHRILRDSDMHRLLVPSDVITFNGDNKMIEEKLQVTATKLTSLSNTVLWSAAKPESLARSAHAVADVAAELAAIARAIDTHDPIQNKRIHEAAQDMCLSTYLALSTAEATASCPADPATKRRLLEACRNLCNAINRLTRTTLPRQSAVDCNELSRCLQSLRLTATPCGALPYAHCVDALGSQGDVIQKLQSDTPSPRRQQVLALSYVTSAVCNSAQYAAHAAYLLNISESHLDSCKEGLVDVSRISGLSAGLQEQCFRVIRGQYLDQIKDQEIILGKQLEELKQAIKESAPKANQDIRRELTECAFRMDTAGLVIRSAVNEDSVNLDKVSTCTMSLVSATNTLNCIMERPTIMPVATESTSMADDIMDHSRKLISCTQALVKQVHSYPGDDEEPMTWVTFGDTRSKVLDAFEALRNSVRRHGQRLGLIEELKEVEDDDGTKKSYVQIQVGLAKKWLHRRPSRPEVQSAGEEAARIIISLAKQLSEDLKGHELEDLRLLIAETEQLVGECSHKYDGDKASALLERLSELRTSIERGAVSRVVDDFLDADCPLELLDVGADAEGDEAKRKFLLEKKIAELMAQLGRVRRTAHFVATTKGGPGAEELAQCSERVDLLAPALVIAAHERVASAHDAAVVQRYRALLAEYAEAMAQVRDRCDRAVDPMDFVQAAGETMQRMREESSQHNDPQRCAYTSTAITKLANRVIIVGMSSSSAREDPELKKALQEAQRKLAAATPGPDVRASKMPDWKDTTAEILRATEKVESVLGGELIFEKQPGEDNLIHDAALGLHMAARGWSSRDNELVAVARRMAVLMARLSSYMNTDNNRELITTSKSIVSESHEVARLAKKLALECTDVRIRTNLLQVCERIPTISGQLKMLTTIKGSSLGHQGSEEDKEAMDMVVGNAQNLMTSVQQVLKAAESATVKIASQRGGRTLRWVRKNFY